MLFSAPGLLVAIARSPRAFSKMVQEKVLLHFFPHPGLDTVQLLKGVAMSVLICNASGWHQWLFPPRRVLDGL